MEEIIEELTIKKIERIQELKVARDKKLEIFAGKPEEKVVLVRFNE